MVKREFLSVLQIYQGQQINKSQGTYYSTWLHDGKQHTFPVSTPKDNFEHSAKTCLGKDFEYEELNKKYKDKREKNIFIEL